MAFPKKNEVIRIERPEFGLIDIKIRGTAPYVQHKFSEKSRREMLQKQMDGRKSKNKSGKDARNPEEDYRNAMHLTADGKHGIPAPAFRAAMISACRLADIVMTRAKLTVFVEPDDFDADDGTPLVFIKGKPELHECAVRLATGVASIAIRPMWRDWSAVVRVKFDAGQMDAQSVTNLMMRAGAQVGIGEGRPDSKKSQGMGWGTFEIVE